MAYITVEHLGKAHIGYMGSIAVHIKFGMKMFGGSFKLTIAVVQTYPAAPDVNGNAVAQW